MAVLSGALVLAPLGTISSRFLALSVVLSGVAVLTGVFYASLWLHRWPTRTQSLTMGFLGAALIAVCTVLQSQPIVALMGCCALVIIGGYLAFFHSSKAIICNIVTACVAGTICAARVAALPDHALVATAGLWMVVELNIAVPLAIQMAVHTLGADVVRSHQDALTGVLNRRAFYDRARTLLTIPGPDTQLVVVMIDLDHFKRVNDTYGHSAGDQALTAVGWALRHNCADSALIGRAGGDEFLVIDRQNAETKHPLPEKLCRAIAELPHPVTASVGAAVTPWNAIRDPDAAVETLVKAADTAMYHAKRSGGNQVSVQALARAQEQKHRGHSAEPP
ncbi:GGDEF domain-containing protein [Mycobacterium sp. 236(2023)]|uniref:GGDEF domain-containing protein n=1 Tax=Mycobacterium sp. 236(2023) TaxID=3038163 RepID=UPI0024156A84|nr:GGDEF domain-containing protein [Mycobacterium sp. 236(2023)]MDG4668018.1 GGDEF domain-containing protein [Mycobacterium sp. 236(2023)]